MVLPRMSLPRGSTRRRVAHWSAFLIGSILPAVGCQVEYAGMTLPSGRYMHDDVQYFPSGPDFPWANSQAATQRARMRAMGIEAPPEPGVAPVGGGALDPTQGQLETGGRMTNPNVVPERMPPGATGRLARRGSPRWTSGTATCGASSCRPAKFRHQAATIPSNSSRLIAEIRRQAESPRRDRRRDQALAISSCCFRTPVIAECDGSSKDLGPFRQVVGELSARPEMNPSFRATLYAGGFRAFSPQRCRG